MKIAIVFALITALTAGASPTIPNGANSNPMIQNIVLFQDFENPGGWDGANPPSGWTLLDYGQADGIWDSYDWYKYTGWGSGTARVSGGTINRYNNDWIISPAIDFSSASACTLSFRHYYDDYLTQSADSALVLLSNDNGISWSDTAMVYAGADYGSDTVPDSVYFNISAFVSGHNQVKVAFQYVKRQTVVTGSWRIDDIRFIADGSTLMYQDFESGWGPNGNNPPSGWAILDSQVAFWDENDWHQENISGWGNIAYVYWSPIEKQNEFLIGPGMDFSTGAIDIKLTLKQWYNHETTNLSDSGFVLGSIDGGITWPETLAIYQNADHGSLSSPAYDTLDIHSWANNQSDVKLGFKYVGINNGWWYIDSVGVETFDLYANNVGVISIPDPPDTTVEGFWWPVSAVVENAGINTNSFDVVFQILDSSSAIVYSDTQMVANLASLQQTAVYFEPWYASEPNSHSLRCFTKLNTDMDHQNDTASSSIETFHHIGQDGPVDGWTFKDNITGGGDEFNWINIHDIGTPIGFSDPDDGNSGMIDMGIEFYYFGQIYTRIAVSTDGWLSFADSTGSDNTPSGIPDLDGPASMIALLWDDLHLGTGQVYYYPDSLDNRFIIQFDSVEYVSSPGSQLGMEVIFDGVSNSIKMQYNFFTFPPPYEGTIGIENQAQDTGLPYDNNGQVGQTPQNGIAVTYYYLPPHDIKMLSIDQPSTVIQNGSTYDVIAAVCNAGANMESFDVTAFDNHGWTSTQLVSNLASLDTISVTFSNWQITSQCDTFDLTVYSDLGDDYNRSNDTVNVTRAASLPSNLDFSFDDGRVYSAITSADTSDVVASKLSTPYENTVISAVAYKLINEDELPGNESDSFVASIFIDNDNDGIPDAAPVYTRRLLSAKHGWTVWNIGCDTALSINCKNIWVAWSIADSARASAIGVDQAIDFPEVRWARELGQWHLLPVFYGDYMIRAWVTADTSTKPRIDLGDRNLIGAAAPDGMDTASTYIQNNGNSCDLAYKVSVSQTSVRYFADRNTTPSKPETHLGQPEIFNLKEKSGLNHPIDPPVITGSGGPDDYGYIWTDSDDPGGPMSSWIDISGVGTPVVWDHGDSDDGYTEPVPMGMTFNYYGINYDSLTVSTNGWVSFGRASTDAFAFSDNIPIPYPYELTNILAVEWDNLTGGATGQCYYYHDTAVNAFVISWIGWSHAPGEIEPHNFQIILDGGRGTITYQYQGTITQSDYTVGIENADNTDGLQVAYNQQYLHDGLAILFKLPVFWLSTDLAGGILPAGSGPHPFNIFMSAVDIPGGTYNGAIIINNNDVDEPAAVINVQFQIEGACSYVPGDINGSGSANGLDVVFMVGYFKGGDSPHEECPSCGSIGPGMIYPQGDVNGSCSWNGLDVTFFVSYLKGVWPSLRYCEQCPPGGRILVVPPHKPGIEQK